LPAYQPTPKDEKLAKLAQPFLDEMELAFFVVEIGMSKSEYESLTETEKLFIKKRYEQKFINDTIWMRNAMLNAVSNALRKKNQKFRDLFPKKQHKADKEYNKNAIEVINRIEKRDGKGWVDLVYKRAGIKKPRKKESR